MSWPQNPDDPRLPGPPGQQPVPPQQPQPQQGFGPPPVWPQQPEAQQPVAGSVPPQQPPSGYGHPQQPYPPQQPQPYGAQPGQQPYPPPHGYGYPQQPAVPVAPVRKRRQGLIVTVCVVAVALVAGGVTLALRSGHHGTHKTPVAAGSSSPAASFSAPAPGATDQGPSLSDGASKPLIAGWQTQGEASHGFSYDVPPASQKWKVNSPDLELAYTDKKNNPVVVMSASSEYRLGGCDSPGSHTGAVQAGTGQLATVGEQGSTKGTLQDNARNVAGNWVWAAYGGADGHKPQKITVTSATPWKHNGVDGYMAKATATGIYRTSGCVPPTAVAYGISMRLKDGSTGLWVLYADQGVPNALTDAQIQKIMSTVRPYAGG